MTQLRVRDLMTSNVKVIRPDDPVTSLRELMDERRIRHVPVVDDEGALVGLVSERDLLRRVIGPEDPFPLSVQDDLMTMVKVSEVMTWEVETIEPDEEAEFAAQIMLENKYGCLPVVDGDRLVGILTEADFVKFVATSAHANVGTKR